MIRRALLAATLVLALSTAADAQTPPAALRRRMRGFTTALREQAPMQRIASFFPRRASWEWVETQPRTWAAPVVLRRHFDPGATLAAISEGGEICESFGGPAGEIGPMDTKLVAQAELPWRYAGRNRFVPRGRRSPSPSFVEWAWEDGAWVIARIGEEGFHEPKLLGTSVNPWPEFTRDTLAGAAATPAIRNAAAAWLNGDRPLHADRRLFEKYGLPLPADSALLERFGTFGGVPVFVERGSGRTPDLLYLLTAPGEYQKYQGVGGSLCRSDENRAAPPIPE